MTPNPNPSPELLPCPFCGGEATLTGFRAPEFWVYCNGMGCKASTEAFGSQHRAITAWNTRALSPQTLPAPGEVETVREAFSGVMRGEVVNAGAWSLNLHFGRGDDARDRMRAASSLLDLIVAVTATPVARTKGACNLGGEHTWTWSVPAICSKCGRNEL